MPIFKTLRVACTRTATIAGLICLLSPAYCRADSVPTNGLIGYWTGNSTANDSSVTANNGTFSGSYVAGRPGGDSAFNLGTGTVTIVDNAAYDFHSYSGWTVGFWFNTNGITPNGNNDTFLGQDNGGGSKPKWFIDYGYSLAGPSTDFSLHLNDFNGEALFFDSSSVSPLGSGWNQLTVVVDNAGNTVTFYLNGTSIGQDALPAYVLQPTAPLVFGGAEVLTYGGYMNDVTIYNRALSSNDVGQLVGITPEPSPWVLVGTALCLGGLMKVYSRKNSLSNIA